MGQNLKHIRIYSLGFFTCMVGKVFLLISQGRLEPCNLTKLLGIVGDLKGVTKLST
jgi:hypothetical protein